MTAIASPTCLRRFSLRLASISRRMRSAFLLVAEDFLHIARQEQAGFPIVVVISSWIARRRASQSRWCE
jgi:hypothetical protein